MTAFAVKLILIHLLTPAMLIAGFLWMVRRLRRGDMAYGQDQYLLGSLLLLFVFYGFLLTALLYLVLDFNWWTGLHSLAFGAALIVTPMVSLVLAVLAWPGRGQSRVHQGVFFGALLFPVILIGVWGLAGVWLGAL